MAILTPYEVAESVVNCAFDAVPNSNPWPIRRKGVVPGEIAWDECECGQLAIQEVRRYPSIRFPDEETRPQDDCGESWLVHQFTLALTRCSPGTDDNGRPPAMEALASVAERMSLDMTLVRKAVFCCLDTHYNDSEILAYTVDEINVVGPSGLCVGFTLDFRIGYTGDCGCS